MPAGNHLLPTAHAPGGPRVPIASLHPAGRGWPLLRLHPALETLGASPGLGKGRCGCGPTPWGCSTSQTLGLGTRTQGCHQRDKPKQLPPSSYFPASAPGGAAPAPSSPLLIPLFY